MKIIIPVLGQAIQAFRIRSFAVLRRLYTIAVTKSRPRLVRTACMTVIVLFFLGRTARLFPLRRTMTALLVGAVVFGTFPVLAISTLALLAITFSLVWGHPDDGIGHRVGHQGYDGAHVENTIEALYALAKSDKEGAYDGKNMPFIEFDVQETKDNVLVLFHDATLAAAFPEGPTNDVALGALRNQGFVDLNKIGVSDLTLTQLRSLNLAGREGIKMPTFRQFLEECLRCRVRRSLAVEVKSIHSDAGRQALVDNIAWYVNQVEAELSSRSEEESNAAVNHQYRRLGWAGVIAFPQFYAASFGEFGSLEWRRWAKILKHQGISARCCHFHYLDFRHGA